MRTLAIALLLLLSRAASARAETQAFTLENGLRVVLRAAPPEAPGAAQVAIVVLFDVGELHDPPGRSGLGHLIEHLYVTAACAAAPERDADEWFQAYGGQANAQTGRDYTLVATVFPSARLDAELGEAAARLRGVTVTDERITIERARVGVELANMYGGMPGLAAMNTARNLIDPLAPGARKGGVVEQAADVTADEITRRLADCYRPRNATLVVAGAFNADAAPARIRAIFGDIPSGVAAPAPAPVAPALAGAVVPLDVPRPVFGDWPAGIATLAFLAPRPSEKDYPAFILLAARIMRDAMRGGVAVRVVAPASYAFLDDPTVLFVNASLEKPGDDADADVAALRARLARTLAITDVPPADAAGVLAELGPMLGSADMPDFIVSSNPYFAAFVLGRTRQLGIDGAKLGEAMRALTAEDLKGCAERVFGEGQGAAAVVRVGG